MVLAVLLLVSLTLITLDLRGGDDSPVGGPRGVVSSVFGQIERAAAAVVRPVAGGLEAVGDIGRSQDRIDELEAENDELREELNTLPFEQTRLDRLERMLGLAGRGGYEVVAAHVIALGSGQGFARTATIDAGSDDGLKPDMTVINGDGLVGRVTRVDGRTATVLLAIDPEFTVGVRVEGEDELGFLEGRGGDPMELQLLKRDAALADGDRVVTFGSEGGKPFVPGVPVGTVTAVRGTPGAPIRVADVEPFVSFSSLDVVAVVVSPPDRDPRDAVLPDPPVASTTPAAGAPASSTATSSATSSASSSR